MKNLRGFIIIVLVNLVLVTVGYAAAPPHISSGVIEYFNNNSSGYYSNVQVVSGGKIRLTTYNYSYSSKKISTSISKTFSATGSWQSHYTWKPSYPWNNGTIVKVRANYKWYSHPTSVTYNYKTSVQRANASAGTGFITPQSTFNGYYPVSVNSNTGLRLTGYVGTGTSGQLGSITEIYISGSYTGWRPNGAYRSKVTNISTLDTGKFYSFGRLNCDATTPSGTSILVRMRASASAFTEYTSSATVSWQTVCTIDDDASTPIPAINLDEVFGSIDAKYFQFYVNLYGTSPSSGAPTPSANSYATPYLNELGAELIFEHTLVDPESHDNSITYSSPSSFNESGANFNSGRVVRVDPGLKVQQYTSYNVKKTVNSSNSVNPVQNNGYTYSSGSWLPTYPGFIKKVQVALYWIISTQDSAYNQKVWLKTPAGSGLTGKFLPTYNPSNGWYSGIKSVNVNSNLGLKMVAYGASRHDTPNLATGNAYSNHTSRVYYAWCDEYKYHTSATYTSKVLNYGDPALGGNGFSWGHILWNTNNTDASNTIKLYVRGDKNNFSTSAGSTDVNWTLVLDTGTSADEYDISDILYDKPYMQYKAVFRTNSFQTPSIDWLTIKYFTNSNPTLTIKSVYKGSSAYPNYSNNPGYHVKPPLTGSPANDVAYSTGTGCNTWPGSHSNKPNLIAKTPSNPPELYIKIRITDPEGDMVKSLKWQYTIKSKKDVGIWYNFSSADIKWDLNGSTAQLQPITTTKSALTNSSHYYTLCFKNLTNYFAGVYNHVYFRCTASDGIFETDYVTTTESQKFFVDFNSPPSISSSSLEILPDPAYTTDTLTLNTSSSASDPDQTPLDINGNRNDEEHLSFVTEWSVNGSPITGINTPTLPSNYFIKGDEVEVSVYPFDGSISDLDFPDYGKEFGLKTSTTRTIKNKPPVITSITLSPSTPYTNDDLICTVVATDDDEFIWRQTDFQNATINNMDMGDGVFDPINCDGNITTTDVDLDGEYELQLK